MTVFNGELKTIYNDEFLPFFNKLGEVSTTRASYVEPIPGSTDWSIDLTPVGGPILRPFKTRDEAIQTEINWLLENRI